MTAVDEVYVEQNKSGTVLKQIARVRVFFISFLSGKHKKVKCWILDMTSIYNVYWSSNNLTKIILLIQNVDMPEVEVGVNDITRMGLEVVGRHDILPVPTEQWIRYENIEFHPLVDRKEFEKNDHIIKYEFFE